MKKLFSILTAMLLVFAAAGTAAAALGVDSIALSAFDPNGNEVILDLGLLDYNQQDLFVENIANIGDYTQVGAHMLQGNAFIGEQQTIGTNNPTAPAIVGTLSSSFSGAAQNIQNNNDAGIVHPAGDDFSFVSQMGDNGSYAGFNDTQVDGVISLEFLSLNPVDIFLYMFESGALVPGAAADYQAMLTIYDSGDVVLNANPVPVPAAVWLLGSGLLALVGVRRRKS